ncbi:uncharacterized protein LOC111481961 [Cucurbita maxima]|uniref:Uncharacterized protein LOC111481961 n=1 Tax=Cucurbita maxima TaxID=3661 RepID=A0A6J1J7I6_CUCMA|nr:uncharacterized protein LOC111481961 [Cucurbita maxima]
MLEAARGNQRERQVTKEIVYIFLVKWGPLTSDYHTSSVDLSPRSLEKHGRPMNDAVKVTELKGSLLERMDKIEDRVLKLCLQVEGEIEREREMIMVEKSRKKPKKSFKQLFQHCITWTGKI